MAGQGYKGFLGLAKEVAYGTKAASTAFLNILGESFKTTREYHVPKDHQSTAFDKIGLPTVRGIAGGFNLEANGVNAGLPLRMSTRAYAYASLTSISGTPTATPAAGGSLAEGTFKYKVFPVFSRTADSKKFIGNAGTEFEGTTAGGNLTLNLDWTANPTPPTGYTYAGTAIFRTAVGGGSGTELYLTYNSGAGTTFTDDGDPALGTAAMPSATVRKHTFTQATAELDSWTLEVNPDMTNSRFILGFKAGSLKIDCPEPGKPITFSIDGTAMNETTSDVAGTESFTLLKPFSTHNGITWVQASGAALSQATKIEKMSVDLKYEQDPVRSFNFTNGDMIRALNTLRHEITGSFSISFEDYVEYNRVLANTLMSLKLMVDGPYTSTTESWTMGGSTVYAWPYQLIITLPNIYYNVAQGNLNGPKRIVEDVPFKALYDSTTTTDITIELYNTSTTYA